MTPAFLQRLGLDLDADTKSVRRAYSRELKLIDQEFDLPGFQLLREAYEAALAWDKHKQGDPDEASAPAIALDDPHALSAAVMGRLNDNIGRIVLGSPATASLVEQELRTRLDDEELLNITARNLFEARIAHLLFSEWTLEAGVLFGAAATVFNWAQDRRRVRQFGHAGAFLDRVIEERSMFQAQEPGELNNQRHVMARLRDPEPPNPSFVRLNLIIVERMITRFPNLLAIMVSREAVEQWHALAQLPVDKNSKPEPVTGGAPRKSIFSDKWLIYFIVMALFAVVRNLPDKHTPPVAANYPSYAADAVPIAPPTPQTVLSLWVAINNDIQYYPAKRPKGKLRVVFDVLANADGIIYGVNRRERSIDPVFDKAAEEAIMRARTLPVHMGSSVHMEFSR
jgi:hypothetical protein